MTQPQPTTADTSGVTIDRRRLAVLMMRSNRQGALFLAGNLALLAVGAGLVHLTLGTVWIAPAMLFHGGVMTTACYALSHESAHRTAFASRWANEAAFWITSFIYMESPTHRRAAHMRHHNHTWIAGADAQMPFATPLTPWGWLKEISGVGLLAYEAKLHALLAAGRIADEVAAYLPPNRRRAAIREARAILGFHGALIALAAAGVDAVLVYFLIPRLVGGAVMQTFAIVQHAEMREDSPDLRRSTRSFRTNWFGGLIYWNMSHHLEHHLFPMTPFHALPELRKALEGQLPEMDNGLLATNGRVLSAVLRRARSRRAVAEPV